MITLLTNLFQETLQDKDTSELKMLLEEYSQASKKNADFFKCDSTEIRQLNQLAIKVTEANNQATTSTPPPPTS